MTCTAAVRSTTTAQLTAQNHSYKQLEACHCCRYEKYDKPMGKRRESRGGDPYSEEYDNLQAEIDDLHKVGPP